MSTNFPTSLDDSTSIPVESAGTVLATNHVASHTNLRSAILAIEAIIGVTASAVNTTINYILSEITGGDKAVGKSATQTLLNKTFGTGTKITLGSDAIGDIHYLTTSNVLARLAIGSTGYILKVVAGIPAWVAETVTVNASSTVAGIVELATSSEINADTATGGTGAPIATTPDQLALSKYNNGGFFGDGNDGDVTIGADTSLTRDMFYNNLTISSGFTLNPSGYRIFVKGTLTINGTGKIARNGTTGSNGNNAVLGAGGAGTAGGTALASGSIAGGVAGGNGANGGTGSIGDASNPNASSAGNAPSSSNITNAIGSQGAVGGAGGAGGTVSAGTTGGGTGGTASTVTNPPNMPRTATFAISLHAILDSAIAFMKGSAQGNGGGGGGNGRGNIGGVGGASTGGSGGGGAGAGSSGGIIMICAKAIVVGASASIQALGGTGGVGGNGSSPVTTGGGNPAYAGGGGGGGGAGGSGGVIVLVYRTLTNSGSISVAGGTGGVGGTGAVGQNSGGTGADGSTGPTGATGVIYQVTA